MSIKFTYVGHATYLLDIGGTKIVIDPFFTSNPLTGISADSVEADFVLISHGHFDHIEDAVSIATQTEAVVVSNFEIVGWMQKNGIAEEKGSPHHIGGGVSYPFGHVKLTIAHHGSGLPDGSYGGNPAGFLITAEDKRIYLACDTALFSDMQLYSDVDLAILPIGDRFTMGPDDALQAVKFIKPKLVVPCHYNTWPPIQQDANAWAERVEAETEAKVNVMEPGTILEL